MVITMFTMQEECNRGIFQGGIPPPPNLKIAKFWGSIPPKMEYELILLILNW
jgi:hypothetical protein